MLYKNLDSFVEEMRKHDEIMAIVLYGSRVTNSFDSLSDFDLIICADSENFHTSRSIYEAVAKHSKPKIKPAIKSIKEFSPHNYVTMNRRYIQHLHNVGQVLYERECGLKEILDGMWMKLKSDPRLEAAYKVSPSLIIRHRIYEMCTGRFGCVVNDDGCVEAPRKHFWQDAVDVLSIDVSPEEENKIVEKFYEIVPCGDASDVRAIRKIIEMINVKLRKRGLSEVQEEIKQSYIDFKDLIERDMWNLNEHLKNQSTV